MVKSSGVSKTKAARHGPRSSSILSKKRTGYNETAPETNIKPKKGIVFIKHLPEGFDAAAMKAFFQQYGEITNIHIPRSDRSFRNKGYGYVEFKYEEVAKVAASSVDNYLLFGRKLKASAIPTRNKKLPIGKFADLNNQKECLKWREANITDKNGFVSPKRLQARQTRAAKKLEQHMKALKEANIKINKKKLNRKCFVQISVAEQTAAQNIFNEMACDSNSNTTNKKSISAINVNTEKPVQFTRASKQRKEVNAGGKAISPNKVAQRRKTDTTVRSKSRTVPKNSDITQ